MTRRKQRDTPPAESAKPARHSGDWRVFLALPLPDDVRSMIRELQGTGAISQLPLRLVEPALTHITLHFLGEIAPERAELLSISLPAALAPQRACALHTANLGVFPNERKPRVLWLGLDGQVDGLASMHRTLTTTLRRLGFAVEDAPFRPHVTIGRVRDGSHPTISADLSRVFIDPEVRRVLAEPLTFHADQVHLVRSHLEKQGPRYETLRAVDLARG